MATQQQEIAFGRAMAEEVIQWVAANLSPEEVFTDQLLEQWAKDNGWVKIDNLPAEVQEMI